MTGWASWRGRWSSISAATRATCSTVIHADVVYVLVAAIVLHILAVALYATVKGHDLVRPMITGKKRLPAATRAPRFASPVLALLVLALAAAVTLLIATRV